MFGVKKAESNKFHIGELVEVKSIENIKSLLSEAMTLDGCLFMEQMWDYCGHTYCIKQVINSIFNEHKHRTFKPKAPLYILENLICKGRTDRFQNKCDHSCFILWHEKWLEKI